MWNGRADVRTDTDVIDDFTTLDAYYEIFFDSVSLLLARAGFQQARRATSFDF